MARQSANLPPVNSPSFLQRLRELFDRTQKIDEEYEPSNVIGTGSRIVLTDEDGVRWAVTVDTGGNLTTDAL